MFIYSKVFTKKLLLFIYPHHPPAFPVAPPAAPVTLPRFWLSLPGHFHYFVVILVWRPGFLSEMVHGFVGDNPLIGGAQTPQTFLERHLRNHYWHSHFLLNPVC